MTSIVNDCSYDDDDDFDDDNEMIRVVDTVMFQVWTITHQLHDMKNVLEATEQAGLIVLKLVSFSENTSSSAISCQKQKK